MESLVQELMEQQVKEKRIAGVNLLVIKNGEEIYHYEAGMADAEAEKPMRRDTIFRLYSQTKPITAAAALLLMEKGKLDLCQRVSDFFPCYEKLTVWKQGHLVPAKRPMLVQDLLRMTSGLAYPDEETIPGMQVGVVFRELDERLFTGHAMSVKEAAEALGSCALLFEPGDSWQYGASADVLGAVIEQAAGISFGEFLHRELLEPLEMEDTDFWVPEEKQKRLAKAYQPVKRQDGSYDLICYHGNHLGIRNDMAVKPAFESGGAGLAGTLPDYRKFAQMLLDGGFYKNRRILLPSTVRLLTRGELLPHQQRAFDNWNGLSGFSYGNLMRVCKKPDCAGFLAREGEYGWDGWLGMYFANFPKERLTILMGTQRVEGGTFDLTRKLRNLILESVCPVKW